MPILTVLTQIFEAGTRPAKEQDHGGGVWVQLDAPIPHLYLGQFEIIHFLNRRRFQLSSLKFTLLSGALMRVAASCNVGPLHARLVLRGRQVRRRVAGGAWQRAVGRPPPWTANGPPGAADWPPARRGRPGQVPGPTSAARRRANRDIVTTGSLQELKRN